MKGENIKEAGLKVTLPRLQVLEFLEKNVGKHFSADELFTQIRISSSEIGLATIYRVLNQFEEAGLVIKHLFENGQAVYELDTGEHHDHMVDVESGEVKEFYDEEIEALQEKLAKKYGYELVDHSMVLYVKKL
ncbi:MAG TPA: ferric iron uptake transcriptional regulator [Gammaproteobacteria bacterium]|nr:ferric iron uptake transcriptional regulator [Xanthomonadales bacterium]HPI95134.1 ferric iron uptake transcriptional regulator [Gammaproteobacteria bacterium]HPQ86671.1 ferric iron uptake transcriptional regulator [Gammaproteobacteria bacterium]